MSIRAYRDIHRRKSRQIMVGKVPVGGDAPITVQTMTNTITGDARATIDQIRAIEEAGADIVRVSCPDEDATKAMKAITTASNIPVVADIHFHYKRAIEAAVAGAACLRINPGNIGSAAARARKWCRRPRIMAAPCASASMPDRSRRNCSKNMASRAPKRWWRARSTTPRFSMTSISANTRSR